jgi:hypothetical protein
MKRPFVANLVVFCLLLTLGVATRWIAAENQPGLTNFTAIGATALFAGYFFRPRLAALLVPLAVMVVSNLCLRQYNNFGQLAVVYVALLLPVVFGMLLRRNLQVWSVAAGAVASSITFFLVTNFAEWAFYNLYPHTTAGLIEGYQAAIPFFGNTLASDLLFSGLIFGTHWLAVSRGVLSRSELAPAPAPQK